MSTQAESPSLPPPPGCECARCRAHAAGHRGPYSPTQFWELFGAVNAPGPVEVEPELAALGIEVDLAAERWTKAMEAWQAAYVGDDGDDEAAARGVLDDEGRHLGTVRAAYNDLAVLLSRQRAVAAYAADQAAQQAAREAAREAAAPTLRKTLARIRSKVIG